ncbi:MAG: RluA family pseudouridine synthase [Desulfopila sp.]|jgi:23S rRNA pseudouridine1911/1915/1917 synthase|nr:RluA family pseudouridine synthase [Desulfopila sp.]
MKNSRPPSRFTKKTSPRKKKSDAYVVETPEALLTSLLEHLSHKSRNLLKAVLKDGQVTVDGIPVTQFDHLLKTGQCVEISWERAVPQLQPKELVIVFEDADIIVINKPAGLLTVATAKEKRKTAYSMLSSYLKEKDPENKIFVIHRLDRETSGLLLFAKSEAVQKRIQENWNTTIQQRTYVGVVEGRVAPAEGCITSWLKESKAFIVYSSQNPEHGRKAVTHYKVLQANNSFSLLQINLETRRKHQIRVHLQDLNHPVIGDKKYGSAVSPLRRLGLHAQVLAFIHPSTAELCRFETPIPKEFLKLFAS